MVEGRWRAETRKFLQARFRNADNEQAMGVPLKTSSAISSLRRTVLDILCINYCARCRAAIAVADKGWIFVALNRLVVAVDKTCGNDRIPSGA
jgi:hypothetical protein